jgi:hypothetical protein
MTVFRGCFYRAPAVDEETIACFPWDINFRNTNGCERKIDGFCGPDSGLDVNYDR